MNVKCRCGQDSGVAYPEPSFMVGELAVKTGFSWLALPDGESVWICPECFKRAYDAAETIRGIVGSEHASVWQFLRKGKTLSAT